jgi:hypothetical protein
MAQARGIATKIQVWDETTYGVTPATPVGENMYFRTCNVKGSIARAIDDTINGKRGEPASIMTNRDISGQIVQTLAPQSCIKMLKHLIGIPVNTTITTAHQYVFSLAGGALPPSFGMEQDFSTAIATPGRFLVNKGCRVSKGSFKFTPAGFIDATYDIRGATFDLSGTVSLDPTTDDFGHAGFSMFTAVIKEGGSVVAIVTDFTVNMDNDLDDTLFVIGGGGVRGALPEGFFKISGTITALFQDAALLNKGLNNTESSLEIILTNGVGDGTAGNESFDMTLPNLFYDFQSPEIPGPKGLKVTLNFTAHRSGAAEQAASVTVKAMRATA